MINRAQEHNDEATEVYDRISILTSSAAQGGGGSFKNRKPIGEIVVNHGWQSESTDGPKGDWSCVFASPITAGCSVVL